MTQPLLITLDDSQQLAVELMRTARFCCVTGGAGVGKSTCLRTALDQLDAEDKQYLLAAPTGKAARRVQETTGRPARTIHRLLEFSPRTNGFTRNETNVLEVDAVFVDEASMIDVELGAALFAAIDPARTRLVLIGDANQLPPVGPGRPFGDLVESGMVPVARLTTLHRSALDSWIHVNAQKVLLGEMIDLQQRADFRFVEVEESSGILPALLRLVTETIPREIAPSMGTGFGFQVLIPQRPGVAGIEAANAQLQQRLNPRKPEDAFLPRGKSELRIGDKVIQTKNDYKLVDSTGAMGVFNGEIGDVVKISKDGVTVHFPDRGEVPYSLEQSNALQHAYALTCHRAQGSEWPWVVVVCHSTHSYILTQQLLYTAITRGKKGVVLVGNHAGIKKALDESKPPKRNTALIERMKGELEAMVL